MTFDNLCMNCFERLTDGSICRKCGFDNDSPADMLLLPRKTLLANRYVVGKDISHESDAVTYMGYDTERESVITIRELLPKELQTGWRATRTFIYAKDTKRILRITRNRLHSFGER